MPAHHKQSLQRQFTDEIGDVARLVGAPDMLAEVLQRLLGRLEERVQIEVREVDHQELAVHPVGEPAVPRDDRAEVLLAEHALDRGREEADEGRDERGVEREGHVVQEHHGDVEEPDVRADRRRDAAVRLVGQEAVVELDVAEEDARQEGEDGGAQEALHRLVRAHGVQRRAPRELADDVREDVVRNHQDARVEEVEAPALDVEHRERAAAPEDVRGEVDHGVEQHLGGELALAQAHDEQHEPGRVPVELQNAVVADHVDAGEVRVDRHERREQLHRVDDEHQVGYERAVEDERPVPLAHDVEELVADPGRQRDYKRDDVYFFIAAEDHEQVQHEEPEDASLEHVGLQQLQQALPGPAQRGLLALGNGDAFCHLRMCLRIFLFASDGTRAYQICCLAWCDLR